MVIINTKTNQVYINVSKTQAARLIGVDRSTVYRWSDRKIGASNIEVYNNFTIYFEYMTLPKMQH